MYQWMVWFHILSLISWFAVLFYLPRLFVYHAENASNAGFVEVIKVMEMKIYKYIGIPAMWATVLSGSYLAYELGFSGGWLHAKIFFVLILMAYFFTLGHFREQFLADNCHRSGKFFRMYNEVPTILLMIIVAMVILKPF